MESVLGPIRTLDHSDTCPGPTCLIKSIQILKNAQSIIWISWSMLVDVGLFASGWHHFTLLYTWMALELIWHVEITYCIVDLIEWIKYRQFVSLSLFTSSIIFLIYWGTKLAKTFQFGVRQTEMGREMNMTTMGERCARLWIYKEHDFRKGWVE